jgi:hypothetical protein
VKFAFTISEAPPMEETMSDWSDEGLQLGQQAVDNAEKVFEQEKKSNLFCKLK